MNVISYNMIHCRYEIIGYFHVNIINNYLESELSGHLATEKVDRST